MASATPIQLRARDVILLPAQRAMFRRLRQVSSLQDGCVHVGLWAERHASSLNDCGRTYHAKWRSMFQFVRCPDRPCWGFLGCTCGVRTREVGMDTGTVTSVVPVRVQRRGAVVADRGWPGTLPPRGGSRMSSPIVAQSEPYGVELEAGKNYAWCACGRSANQPWCDGSHRDTEFSPIVWKAEKTETVFLCGCKSTGDSPYCDGTHNLL